MLVNGVRDLYIIRNSCFFVDNRLFFLIFFVLFILSFLLPFLKLIYLFINLSCLLMKILLKKLLFNSLQECYFIDETIIQPFFKMHNFFLLSLFLWYELEIAMVSMSKR